MLYYWGQRTESGTELWGDRRGQDEETDCTLLYLYTPSSFKAVQVPAHPSIRPHGQSGRMDTSRMVTIGFLG